MRVPKLTKKKVNLCFLFLFYLILKAKNNTRYTHGKDLRLNLKFIIGSLFSTGSAPWQRWQCSPAAVLHTVLSQSCASPENQPHQHIHLIHHVRLQAHVEWIIRIHIDVDAVGTHRRAATAAAPAPELLPSRGHTHSVHREMLVRWLRCGYPNGHIVDPRVYGLTGANGNPVHVQIEQLRLIEARHRQGMQT